ncbi:MAG: hypothetical protein WCO23_00980 [bacterium]
MSKKENARKRERQRLTIGSGVNVSRPGQADGVGIVVGFHRIGPDRKRRVYVTLLSNIKEKILLDPSEVTKTILTADKKTTSAPIALKPQDRVKVVAGSFQGYYLGHIGTVVHVYAAGTIRVRFSSYEDNWFDPKDLVRC